MAYSELIKNFENIHVIQDLAGLDRVVYGTYKAQ